MKLEPVYLLAPSPAAKAIPSKRALLGIACAAILGLLGGVLAGLAIGRHARIVADDPMRQWLHQLADDTSPLEELLHNHSVFLSRLTLAYRDDRQLWHGFERLADAVIGNSELPERRLIAGMLLRALDGELVPIDLDAHRVGSQLALVAR